MNTFSFAAFAHALQSSASRLPDRVLEWLRPMKPYDFLKAQPESLATILPYESFLRDDGGAVGADPTISLGDGSVGLIWELETTAHEVLSDTEIGIKAARVAEIVDKMRNPRVALQMIFDSQPSPDFVVPDWLEEPKGVAASIMAGRVFFIQSLASAPRHHLALMKRRLFLTLRLAPADRLMSQRGGQLAPSATLAAIADSFAALRRELRHLRTEVEFCLDGARVEHRRVGEGPFLGLLRSTFHDLASHASLDLQRLDAERENPETMNSPLRERILSDFVEMTSSAVTVGRDTWEVASWLDQPPSVYEGLWSRLLEIDVPLRLVVNILPHADTGDLETKGTMLRHASDALGELQRSEIRAAQEALARGENLCTVSVHLLVRNVGKSYRDVQTTGQLEGVMSRLRTETQIRMIKERFAAPLIFLLSLPFGYSGAASPFSGRAKRVLGRNLAPYLPLFGGFKGTRTPLQLMVSRAGDPVWLNPFDSETSAHVAILASSGGGKSFFAQNLMMSFLAAHHGAGRPPLLFIIDKKTSYEILARTVGEEVGAEIIKPPCRFPSLFHGEPDDVRLPVMVGVLRTAISLVSPGVRVSAVHEQLLALAIRAAFAGARLDSITEYEACSGGRLTEKLAVEQVQTPRLSDVLNLLLPVAAEAEIARSVAEDLRVNLSPFVGNGPYHRLFDQEEDAATGGAGAVAETDATPGISLYDIDQIAGNPVLATLTTQVILAEILRQIRRPENRGRPGMLVIEEAGVLAGESPELVLFIQDAWKTFRKLGFSCIGVTNEVADFLQKPGPREIWNVSPTKIILRLLDKDLEKALTGDPTRGLLPLIRDQHIGKLIGSLTKRDGHFAQGLWWSDEATGTFHFEPTGFDYWCAASKPIEIDTVELVRRHVLPGNGPATYAHAVGWLARHFPLGVRGPGGALRALARDEIEHIEKSSEP